MSNTGATVNQWISSNGDIYVVINHLKGIISYTAFLIPNSPLLADIYKDMGYVLKDTFVEVDISLSIPETGGPIPIPITSSTHDAATASTRSENYNAALNMAVTNAYKSSSGRDLLL